jgi:hypothetical protein
MYPQSINPFTMKMLNGKAEIEGQYAAQLGRIKGLSSTIPGGAPTLIGEFGIPFDLDGCAAYEAWTKGDRSTKPWERLVELAYKIVKNSPSLSRNEGEVKAFVKMSAACCAERQCSRENCRRWIRHSWRSAWLTSWTRRM